jgi:hypothetical protein
MTLGRKNNGYIERNIEWQTPRQQANERRDNRKVTAFGRTANLGQWARLFWMDDTTLRQRLELGLSPERALLEQGAMRNRVIASDAPFEERAEWMRRFTEAQAKQRNKQLPLHSGRRP